MSPEKSIVLASATFGSVYLCMYSLEQLNKKDCFTLSLPNICNYIMLGFSSGVILSITKRVLENEN